MLMETEAVRVAFVTEPGAAHLDIYLSCLAQAAGVEEVVIVDRTAETFARAKMLFAKSSIRLQTWRDGVEMLKTVHPALAVVSLEAWHAPATIETMLDWNCHVLAEKPACIRPEDFARLAQIADSKHRFLMLALANRLSPPVRKARELIQSGRLGKLYGLNMHYVADQTRLTRPDYQQSWFASRAKAGGGHLIWLGIHYLDLAQYVTGQKIARVCGFSRNVGGQPLDVEDAAAVAMSFDDGMLGTLQSGYFLDRGKKSLVTVWGAQGWLQFDGVSGTALEWYSSAPGTKPKVESFAHEAPDAPGSNLYASLVGSAVDAVRGRVAPFMKNEEGLHVLKAIFALYRAAETGSTQAVA
ncbi:MAG: Gfo/Idh/MocA family oxidoreductase [Acidobacteriota bacterium]